MKRLLIGIDGSDASRVAIEEGTKLARELDAAILFLYVKPWPPALLGEPYYQRRISREGAFAEQAVERATDAAAAADVQADWEILEGHPAAEIARTAIARDADLIVVGSRGLGAVKGAVLGSVSNAVVQEADRPVLVARLPAPRSKRLRIVAA
jgi:nucleotide-binding universal stress UspA family protein